MKKTFWSLAALMLMAATMMTSCSNDLDEVAPVEETKSNVVTITIAPPVAEPETRVAMGGTNDLTITGWEVGDVVNLYKATPGAPSISGAGVEFTCTNASGTFSATLPGGEIIDDYNLAIFGGTAENMDHDGGIKISPTTWSSTELKDVVMMGAIKDDEGKFTMKVINNVMKIKNKGKEDVTVAWYGYDSFKQENHYFELACELGPTVDKTWWWYGNDINAWPGIPTWINVSHITLEYGDNYVNFPMVNATYETMIGLYTEGETAVVTMKAITYDRISNKSHVYCGHLLNAGSYDPDFEM